MPPIPIAGAVPSSGGGDAKQEGSQMLRKTSLMLLGAAAGVTATLLVSDPHLLWDGARAQVAVRDTYSQLMLFGDVFERVRDDFVEKPDDGMLVGSALG